MDESKTVLLSVDAEETIHGPLGAVRPSFILRCKEEKTQIYVFTGMAATIEEDFDFDEGPSDTHKVRIGLDDGVPSYASSPCV